MLLGHLISKAVSEVETGLLDALAPTAVRFGDAPCGCRGDGNHLEAEAIEQGHHLVTDVPPRRNNQALGKRAG